MSAGFWFGADGSVIVLDQTHILAVIREPERFGETQAGIEREYARFNEPMPCERRAREAILRRVIGRGWIRVRRYWVHWVATVWNDDPATRGRVGRVANQLLQGIDGITEHDRFAVLRMNAVGEPAHIEKALVEWAADRDVERSSGVDKQIGQTARAVRAEPSKRTRQP